MTIHELELDGALVVRAVEGASVIVRRLCVRNGGSTLRELDDRELDSEGVPEVARLRGYEYVGAEVRELAFDTPGAYIVDES